MEIVAHPNADILVRELTDTELAGVGGATSLACRYNGNPVHQRFFSL